MFCCALGTVILTALALWRKRLRGLFVGGLTSGTVMAGLIVIGTALAGLALVTEHFGHAVAWTNGASAPVPLCGRTEAKE